MPDDNPEQDKRYVISTKHSQLPPKIIEAVNKTATDNLPDSPTQDIENIINIVYENDSSQYIQDEHTERAVGVLKSDISDLIYEIYRNPEEQETQFKELIEKILQIGQIIQIDVRDRKVPENTEDRDKWLAQIKGDELVYTQKTKKIFEDLFNMLYYEEPDKDPDDIITTLDELTNKHELTPNTLEEFIYAVITYGRMLQIYFDNGNTLHEL